MELSLKMLCEKLEILNEYIWLKDSENPVFLSTRLLETWEDVKEEKCLYIADKELSIKNSKKYLINKMCTLMIPSAPPSIKGELPCNIIYTGKRDVRNLLNEILEIFDFYRHWQDQVQGILNRGGSIQELLDCSFPIFQNAIYVIDTSFKVLALTDIPSMKEMSAAWKFLSERGYLSLELVEGMSQNHELEELYNSKKPVFYNSRMFYNHFISANIYIKKVHQGRIFIVGMLSPFRQYHLELAEQLTQWLSVAFCRDEHFQMTQGQMYEHFMIDVITGVLQNEEIIEKQLNYLKWNVNGNYCVAYIPLESQEKFLLNPVSNRLAVEFDAKCVFYEESLVAIFPLQSYDAIYKLESKLKVFLHKLKKRGGISDAFKNFRQIGQYYIQARDIYQIGITRAGNDLYIYREHVMMHMIEICEEKTNLNTFCHKGAFLLIEYDKQHGTEFYKTLKYYIENERSIKKTSEKMFIHRNTLKNRLDRIKEIMGVDLENYMTRMRLMMTFQIIEYIS